MNKNKIFPWINPLLFIVLLLINYLSATGIIFPNTQAEISDKYVNLLAPAGFTFSIWSVIYLGVVLSLFIPFRKFRNKNIQTTYLENISFLSLVWMVLNIVWIISWSYNVLFLSFIAILFYTLILVKSVNKIHSIQLLENQKWFLTYPYGLHAGWLIIASFANITTLFVKIGFNGTGTLSIIWTLTALAIILFIVTFLYHKTKNNAIMLPALWALIGIIAKHSPISEFPHAHPIIFYVAIIYLLIGLGLYIKQFKVIHSG